MSQHETDEAPSLPPVARGGVAVGTAVAFAFATYLITDSAALAGLFGLMTGVGSHFTVPWILSLEAEQDSASGPADDGDDLGPTTAGGAGLHTGALGIGLETGAVVGFAVFFVLESTLYAAGAAVGMAVLEYPLLAMVLPRAD